MLRRATLPAVLLFLLSSCQSGSINVYTCECLPAPTLWWTGPILLYVGQESGAPECPEEAPQHVYEGHADPDTSNSCAPCACGPPRCAPPTSVTVNGTSCGSGGPNDASTLVETPGPWNGACLATGVGYAESLTLPPPGVIACRPEQRDPVPEKLTNPGWKTFGRACKGNEFSGACDDPGEVCAPRPKGSPDLFSQCIMYLGAGDTECPATYPVKHVLYDGVEDTRACTKCECAPPTGIQCAATVKWYRDADCASYVTGETSYVANACKDAFPAAEVGGLRLSLDKLQSGTCAPTGGAPVGEVTPTRPSIFCCRQR